MGKDHAHRHGVINFGPLRNFFVDDGVYLNKHVSTVGPASGLHLQAYSSELGCLFGSQIWYSTPKGTLMCCRRDLQSERTAMNPRPCIGVRQQAASAQVMHHGIKDPRDVAEAQDSVVSQSFETPLCGRETR